MRPARRRQRGQVIPLAALLSLVIFAFGALAIDGGLAFSDKRLDQNAADSAALAGARDLGATLNTTQARQDAVTYLFKSLQLGTPPTSAQCNFAIDIDDSANVCDYPIGSSGPSYRIQVFTPPKNTPAGYSGSPLLPYMLEVRAGHSLVPSGFTRVAGIGGPLLAGANAVALNAVSVTGGPHIAWGLATGTGDSVDVGGTAPGQLDDGSNGTSNTACGGPGPQADLLSDNKLHDPTGHNPNVNVNGGINRSTGNDNSFYQYWNPTPTVTSNSAGDPGYLPPSNDPSRYTQNPVPTVAITATTTMVSFAPGEYTTALTVQPTGSFGGKSWTAGSASTTFVFQNGVYWFNDVNLVFAPGTYQAYSQDYNSGAGGFSPRTVGPDGSTNGVEFYTSGAGYFWAQGGVENFRAPAFVNLNLTRTGSSSNPGTSNFMGIYIDANDTADTGERTQNANGTVQRNPMAIGYGSSSTGYGNVTDGTQYFHVEGTVYVQPNGDPKGMSAIVEGASLNYHKYTVQGQVVAARIGLNMGNNTSATTETGGTGICVDDTTINSGGPTKVVQYSANNVPTLNIGASLSELVH